MNVLVACEFSGRVREAFRKRGHNAWSCDLLPSEDNSPYHYQQNCFDLLWAGDWDLVIAHPPCTHLAVSGARWWKDKKKEQEEAIDFFMQFFSIPQDRVRMLAVENPIGIMSTKWRKPDQIIQPWMFGHGETKATCLWLQDLPPLVPTNIVEGREPKVHHMSPSPDRWKERSRTYQGIADAMAEQWGNL